MQIDKKQTAMILGGTGIAAAAACGFRSFSDLPLSVLWTLPMVLGTIGRTRNSDPDAGSHEEESPVDMIPLVPAARHEGLASIGHEYKNIFQVILGHTFLALDQLDSTDPRRSHLEQVQRSAKQGARLADRIHSLSEEVMSNSQPPAHGDPGS